MGIFRKLFVVFLLLLSSFRLKPKMGEQCKNIDLDVKSTWNVLEVRRSIKGSKTAEQYKY
jgi:hypothetical protein